MKMVIFHSYVNVYQRVYHSRSQIIISWYTHVTIDPLSLSVLWMKYDEIPHSRAQLLTWLQPCNSGCSSNLPVPATLTFHLASEMWHQLCKNPGYRRLLGELPKVWIVSELRLWQNIARIPTLSQFERGKACWSHRLFSVLSREAV